MNESWWLVNYKIWCWTSSLCKRSYTKNAEGLHLLFAEHIRTKNKTRCTCMEKNTKRPVSRPSDQGATDQNRDKESKVKVILNFRWHQVVELRRNRSLSWNQSAQNNYDVISNKMSITLSHRKVFSRRRDSTKIKHSLNSYRCCWDINIETWPVGDKCTQSPDL